MPILVQEAQSGNAEAEIMLGQRYEKGYTVKKNYSTAMDWYRKAADHGDSAGLIFLAMLYEEGKGVRKDRTEALRWYRMAAERGDDVGQAKLQEAYTRGQGLPTGPVAAVRWLQDAGIHGDVSAQLALGAAYSGKNKLGIEQDDAMAADWFRRAAEQDSAIGQYELGNAYLRGKGVALDRAQASAWFNKAAEQRYGPAQYELSNISGLDDAFMWRELAREAGYGPRGLSSGLATAIALDNASAACTFDSIIQAYSCAPTTSFATDYSSAGIGEGKVAQDRAKAWNAQHKVGWAGDY